VLRTSGVKDAHPPVVVTGAVHAQEAKRQLLELGVEGRILAEPAGRDSAPALLAATLWIARKSPEAIVIAVASDHHIPDSGAFAAAVEAARPAAALGAIVTFGVKPTRPAPGFGYIRPGVPAPGAPDVLEVESFIEKPDRETAAALVSSGCLWNSGNFMFRADTMIAEARKLAPGLVDAVERALPRDDHGDDVLVLAPCFAAAERISIDRAVMERTSRAAVLPIDYAWSDLGSWDAVWGASPSDEAGNAISGDATVAETRDCLIRAEAGARVVALGLRNIAVVARGKDVLVSDLAAAGSLKATLPASIQDDQTEPASPGRSVGLWSHRFESWLTGRALPVWWCFGADHEGGGFHEALSPHFAPLDLARRTRVQARQVFVFANAGRQGWQGPWRAAARHGLEALENGFLRTDGLYRFAAPGPGKTPAEDLAPLYEQAFVLLALAAVTEADRAIEPRSAQRATRLAATIREAFSHRDGGFSADLDGTAFLNDPLMHLFEASIAWLRVGGEAHWRDLAGEIFDLFRRRLFDGEAGRVYEAYDSQWRPLQDTSDDRVEPGHQFEWAWLLTQWAAIDGDQRAADMAQQLYRTGRRGVSLDSGLVVDALNDDLSVARASSRLWPQTEWLRAASTLAGDPGERARELCSAAAAIDRYLLPSGLWRDAPADASSDSDHPAPASSFYHIQGAIEVLRAVAREEAG
jgi:mannose-1-phosphate guanylyltransferase/mannose/cellobiose epimerase-like protein (N-acyl-D-glucosamine 2-epimerase family)